MQSGICRLLLAGLFCSLQLLAGVMYEAESEESNLLDSSSFGGRLVRGPVRISPLAETGDPQAVLQIGGRTADGWSASVPVWNSALVADGVQTAVLTEQGKQYTVPLTVLNHPDIVIHEGILTQDEEWTADKIHIVRHWVRIPGNVTLSVQPGTIVKFCPDTGMLVQGTLQAVDVHYVSIHDDTVGGDTDMDGGAVKPGEKDWQIVDNGLVNPDDCGQGGDSSLSLMSGVLYSAVSEEKAFADCSSFGERLVRGPVRISPLAETGDPQAVLQIGGRTADGWSASSPVWNSAFVADGRHNAVLTEQGKQYTVPLTVLNHPDIVIHEGILTQNEEWTADKIHIVRHWVRIPGNVTLSVQPGTIVKFCPDTGMLVQGILQAVDVHFVSIHDDTMGGDTDMDGGAVKPGEKDWQIIDNGLVTLLEQHRFEAESAYGPAESRQDFGGQLVRGEKCISPMADQMDEQVGLNIGGKAAAGWTAAKPVWDTHQFQDGLYQGELNENGAQLNRTLAVLNDSGTMIHGGVLEADEIWTADKIHIVQHWVRIPVGRTLTIASGAVVKFCQDTGIRVDGTLNALDVIMTAVADDSAGGDTDMNGASETGEAAAYAVTGRGVKNMRLNGRDSLETAWSEIDVRTDLGGCLARGGVWVTPTAEKTDPRASLTIGGGPAGGWSPSSPSWNSRLLSDGWYDAVLVEHQRNWQARMAVLNDESVAVHGGMLRGDEFWSADRIHLVRHWVRIPAGRTLAIAAGAVVKFCQDTGIHVEGVLDARQVVFSSAGDDSSGGDTDMNGPWSRPVYEEIRIGGPGSLFLENSRWRFAERREFSLKLEPGWNLLSLPGGISAAEPVNGELLKRWSPQAVCASHVERLSLPAPAGTVIWIFSPGADTVDFVYSEKLLQTAAVPTSGDGAFIGVPEPMKRILEKNAASHVWQWRNSRFSPLPPEKNGDWILFPGKGYVVD